MTNYLSSSDTLHGDKDSSHLWSLIDSQLSKLEHQTAQVAARPQQQYVTQRKVQLGPGTVEEYIYYCEPFTAIKTYAALDVRMAPQCLSLDSNSSLQELSKLHINHHWKWALPTMPPWYVSGGCGGECHLIQWQTIPHCNHTTSHKRCFFFFSPWAKITNKSHR